MNLIVGLGNPGNKYANNRHNVGMMAVDEIARLHNFPNFKSKFNGELADGQIDGMRCFLLKPQTYMNKSGDSVAAAASFYKIPVENVIVIYDELDLAPGKVRVKRGGGHGGHNGLRSIDPQIGKDYLRVRIGIGHPGHKDLVANYVLSDFAKSDELWRDPLLDNIARHSNLLLNNDPSGFMNKLAVEAQNSAPIKPAPAPKRTAKPSPDPKEQPQGPMAAMLKKLMGKD